LHGPPPFIVVQLATGSIAVRTNRTRLGLDALLSSSSLRVNGDMVPARHSRPVSDSPRERNLAETRRHPGLAP
jgi:hypothetical protein